MSVLSSAHDLIQTPLGGLMMTLLAYRAALWVQATLNNHPLANPVIIAVVLLIAGLLWTDTPYETYFEGASMIHFLLGPATVALAVPLYQQRSRLRRIWLPMSVSLVTGVTVAALSSVSIAWILGASLPTQLSLAPKSATAPVAMGISAQIGGVPSLTAALVVTTGVLGSMLGGRVFDWLKIDNEEVRGIAMGVTAHGIGTARAFQISAEMGAFSGLAMALTAFATSVIVPVLLDWLNWI